MKQMDENNSKETCPLAGGPSGSLLPPGACGLSSRLECESCSATFWLRHFEQVHPLLSGLNEHSLTGICKLPMQTRHCICQVLQGRPEPGALLKQPQWVGLTQWAEEVRARKGGPPQSFLPLGESDDHDGPI